MTTHEATRLISFLCYISSSAEIILRLFKIPKYYEQDIGNIHVLWHTDSKHSYIGKKERTTICTFFCEFSEQNRKKKEKRKVSRHLMMLNQRL